ncbi:hypothetical protein O3P69_013470, partial [Scylla paramamosain]
RRRRMSSLVEALQVSPARSRRRKPSTAQSLYRGVVRSKCTWETPCSAVVCVSSFHLNTRERDHRGTGGQLRATATLRSGKQVGGSDGGGGSSGGEVGRQGTEGRYRLRTSRR